MIHTLLPAQCARRVRPAEPQRRLMAAVLRAVVDDCRGGTVYRRSAGKGVVGDHGVRNAIAYVASTDRGWPFSFENLCDALGLDANALRADLIRASNHRRVTSPLRSGGEGGVPQLILSRG